MKMIFIISIIINIISLTAKAKVCADGIQEDKSIEAMTTILTDLSDATAAEELKENLCPLALQGAAGLREIESNIRESDIASHFCEDTIMEDGLKRRNKINDIEKDSFIIDELSRRYFMACLTKEQLRSNKANVYLFKMKQKYPEKLRNLVRLFPKYFSDKLYCRKISLFSVELGDENSTGHMYLSMFNRRLFKLAEYLIINTQSKFGYSLKDIFKPHELKALKISLCQVPIKPDSTDYEIAKSKEYLTMFFKDTNDQNCP